MREFFDVEAIGQFVLGRFLSQATLQEIREYLELFENQMINLHLFYFTSYRLESLTIYKVFKNQGRGSGRVVSRKPNFTVPRRSSYSRLGCVADV